MRKILPTLVIGLVIMHGTAWGIEYGQLVGNITKYDSSFTTDENKEQVKKILTDHPNIFTFALRQLNTTKQQDDIQRITLYLLGIIFENKIQECFNVTMQFNLMDMNYAEILNEQLKGDEKPQHINTIVNKLIKQFGEYPEKEFALQQLQLMQDKILNMTTTAKKKLITAIKPLEQEKKEPDTSPIHTNLSQLKQNLTEMKDSIEKLNTNLGNISKKLAHK